MRACFLVVTLGALAAPAAERRVAITYFDINGGGEDVRPLGKGLADMLITDLLVVKGLSIVERAKLNVLMDELKLSKTPFIDPAAAVKLGKGLSATHMLTGSITVLGSKMNINARVFDVQQSKVVQSKQVEGETQEFFALEKELVDLLIDALELKPDLKEKSALRKSQTESYEAIKGYSQGLDALDKGDKSSAQLAFATAVKADPAWPALKSALDSLTHELDAAEAKGAQSLEQKLNALRPEDPKLFEKIEALAKPRNVPDPEIDAAKRLVLTVIAKRGLRPSRERYVGYDLGGSPLEFWEVIELKDYLTADVEAIAAMPVLLEYLVRKYPDDPSFLREIARSVPAWKRDLLKADLSKPLPPPRDDWRGVRYAFAIAHAQRIGLTRESVKAMANVEQLLAKEETRRTAAFRAEIKKRWARSAPPTRRSSPNRFPSSRTTSAPTPKSTASSRPGSTWPSPAG